MNTENKKIKEIVLTESQIKLTQNISSLKKEVKQYSAIDPASRTHEQNMIITSFNELRSSMRDQFSQDQQRGGDPSNSMIRSQSQTDLAKKSIAQGKNSIYASTAAIQADQKDPALKKVYREQVQNAEEEYRFMDDHKIDLQELYDRLKTCYDGLAKEVAVERNRELGDNALPVPKQTPAWILFAKELLNWFAIMLWVGSGLCVMSYFIEPAQGLSNIYLAIVLIAVVILTGSITYMQTSKANDLMASFKNFLPPQSQVIRGGAREFIDASKLVPGDIVVISSGDKIPADIRIIESREMKVDNTSLTGEAVLQKRRKDCTSENALETENLAFFGTLCCEGQGRGVVIRIGGRTVLGQIAGFASSGEKIKTPLRIELDRFVLIITIIAIVLGILFFFAAKYIVNYGWGDCITFGIGILVANVPEGLLGCITVSLAITANRLSKKQVLVKNLEGVETLGSTSCICSDKTGTLTQNKMTVENVWYDDLIRRALNYQKHGKDHDYEYDINDPTFRQLQECAVVSSDAFFDIQKEDYKDTVWLDAKVRGDASETALVKFFQPIQDIEKTRSSFKFAKNIDQLDAKMPFNANTKYALSIVEYRRDDSDYCVLIKGAPEKLWQYCSYVLQSGGARQIDDQWKKKFEQVNLKFGKNGERVLGFAKLHLLREFFPLGKLFDLSSPEKFNFPLKDLTFVGLVSLIDPPKDSVPWAVKRCRSAGIKVIMVTGDQAPTAGAIAKQVNIIPADVRTNIDLMEQDNSLSFQQATDLSRAIIVHGDRINEALETAVLNGATDDNSDATLQEWVKKDFCVFARTTPAQKLKIVRACQKVGYIVGVTGDGVNDSPAIKQADIGISMGITGAEVTKDAADMILLNDDFSSIVDGVEEGRKIFDNLKKTVVYLLTSNVTEIFPFAAQILFLIPLPLSNMLMLCICVGTDILPAISLAYENAEIDIMVRRPRTKNEHMVTRKLITHAYLQMGVIATAAGFFAFFSTMSYYGFNVGGMFSQKIAGSSLISAKRCDYDYAKSTSCNGLSNITYASFDPNAPNLGNPYLLYNKELYTQQQILDSGYFSNTTQGQESNIDFLFYTDAQYDLRQVIVQYNWEKQEWMPHRDIFNDCQDEEGSKYMNFDQYEFRYEKSPYSTKYYNNQNKTQILEVPVCFSTEAVKYAQTAYFVAIVVTQWSNIFCVKSKKMSIIFSQWNLVMFYGILTETAVTLILCYVPGIQIVFMSRPLKILEWCYGMIFSMFLFVWVEGRKSLMRRKIQGGEKNWFESVCDW